MYGLDPKTGRVSLLLFTPQLYVMSPGDCLDFGDINDGVRVLNGTREKDVVSFRCSDGFDLLGFRQLECGANGDWNGVWPRCFESKCDSINCCIVIQRNPVYGI